MGTINYNHIKKLILGLFFVFAFSSLIAQEHQEETIKVEEFNITEMIMHHIGDSHNFHILEHGRDKYNLLF